MKGRFGAGITVLAMLSAAAALAHHSSAAFDRSKPVNVAGTVKEFRWANPHGWLYVLVPDGKGGNQLWALEGASINIMARNGWTSDSLKTGDKVKCLVAPNRDGSTGGELLSVRAGDGRLLTFGAI